MEQTLRQEEIEHAFGERTLLQTELDQQQKQLRAAQEGLRVARLRLPALDGDGYAKVWMARHAVYTAALQVIDTNERSQAQTVELLALGPACDAPVAATPAAIVEPEVVGQLAVDEGERSEPPTAGGNAKSLGWFVWDGAALLKNPQRVDQIAPVSGRLLLSFSAKEIEALDGAAWRELRRRADARQLRLDLLLGDPGWVYPEGRSTLLKLLGKVRDWPVQGLNLDIERSQLPKPMAAEAWHREVLETMRAARKVVRWPLSLTTHHRDLRDAKFLQALKAAGTDEAVAMIYTTREATARATMERLLAAAPFGLKITLAQSIEPVLSAEESSFKHGRAASVASWRRLANSLSSDPRFGGLIVQSLADYEKASP